MVLCKQKPAKHHMSQYHYLGEELFHVEEEHGRWCIWQWWV